MSNTNWNDIQLILNNQGQIIGDYKPSNQPYGFLRNGDPFTLNEAIAEERDILVKLVYLFFTVGDIHYLDGFEYSQLEGYMLYRKVEEATIYSDLFFRPDLVSDGHFLYLTVTEKSDEYYLMTLVDRGFARAIVSHFDKVYGIDVSIEEIEAKSVEDLDYWQKTVAGSI